MASFSRAPGLVTGCQSLGLLESLVVALRKAPLLKAVMDDNRAERSVDDPDDPEPGVEGPGSGGGGGGPPPPTGSKRGGGGGGGGGGGAPPAGGGGGGGGGGA